MALFLIPRFLPTFWNFLKRRGFQNIHVPYLKTILFMIAMSGIAYAEQNDRTLLKPVVETFCKLLK
jgi:hypothetical protein